MTTVVSRKVGNSVKRNKIKRQMRELFRKNKELLKDTMDMVIIPKKDILKLPKTSLLEEYLSAVETINQKHQSP
jgi:ribonuclease P protein component